MSEPIALKEPPDTNVRMARVADYAAVERLCWDYRALLAARNQDLPEIVEHYYNSKTYARTLKYLPALHSRPDGLMFVATMDNAVVGCAMTVRREAGTCEIKRIFVSEAARGHGLGARLIDLAMRYAKVDGYARMVLDTMSTLREAIVLYERLGFRECNPFYRVDPRFSQRIRFYGIDL